METGRSAPVRRTRRWLLARGGGLLGLGLLAGCGASQRAVAAVPAVTAELTRWAVIGDFGLAGPAAAAVATLVKSWQPEFIITTGDNNYVYGAAETIDENIGQYYHAFIHPYRGRYGAGAERNRFFPSLGNHDWDSGSPAPYLDYFALPGNGRYYDFTWGPVRFFALSSDPREPAGVSRDSAQARWLQRTATTERARWQIAYMHHPPFSSGRWGASRWMQWPYHEWGIDLVLAGHDHVYERLQLGRTTYIVNGLGGAARYPRAIPAVGSQRFFNAEHGALLMEADAERLSLRFVTVQGEVIDHHQRRA